MRIWLVIITMCSLLLLPFSGNSSVLPNSPTMAVGGSLATTMPAAQIETEIAEAEHCNLMAAMHANKKAASESAEHSLIEQVPAEQASAKHTAAHMDCCEEGADCFAQCAADCGHCVGAGHGCSAISAFVQLTSSAVIEALVPFAISNYSLLFVHPAKPPIIA